MAITVKHNKVSTIPDTDDTSLVRPSDWNADHALTGVIDVANGGTGASTLTGYVKGNGTSAMTAVATVPSTDITGLGTMSTQNANAVAITGGSITGITDLAIADGGTGASTASTAFNNLSPLTTAGDTLYGGTSGAGTRLSIGTAGQVLTVNSGATAPQWSTPATGTVTSVGGTGTVSGISLSGTVTSSGNLTLGGTLDLSSPPTIGNTAPNTGKFTTLESTGTGSFGTTSAQYIQAVGNALYPQILAVGSGTNIPLVLQPKGTGALQAQLTDSTATGGNARGAYAIDWQTLRGAASQVASGTAAATLSGASNTANATYATIAGGNQNTCSGVYAFLGGGILSTTSGPYSVIAGGNTNTSAGYFNFIGGGFTNSGTANAAVTTQSGTMNATTAVTLSGSNANIKVGQYITGTSIASDTYVAAISGTSLTLSKVASGSSTSTLSFFTPHGVVVGGGNNQATGAYSAILGGGDAGSSANRNVASGDWSTVGGGWKNTASSNYSFVGGGGGNSATTSFGSVVCGGGFYGNLPTQFSGNAAQGTSAFVGAGFSNIASGFGASVVGGNTNYATSTYSAILGGYAGTTRGIIGYQVFPAHNAPVGTTQGSSQAALLIIGAQTTDATATVLRCDTVAAGTTNQVILPNNSAYFFRGEVVSGVTGGGNTKGWTIEGVIKRGANAASTTLVGTPTVTSSFADAGASTWTIAVTADTTNGGLAVTFTGQASTTIRTVCQIRTTEMTY